MAEPQDDMLSQVVASKNYTVTNKTENPTELPIVKGLDPKDRMLGIEIDAKMENCVPHERTFSGTVLKELLGNPIFKALVNSEKITISQGRMHFAKAA